MKRRWIAIALYVAFIYLTLPVMRPLLDFLYASMGMAVMSVLVNSVLGLLAALVIFLAARKGVARFLLIAVPLIVALAFIYPMERPEERVHFLEYGLLGFMVFSAIGTRPARIALALVFVLFAGALDEFIQLLLPNRVGEIKDVALNFIGGGMGLWVGVFWYKY
jgi:VanZ family protein